jgi:catalase
MSRTYPGGPARTRSARAIPQVTNDPLLQARLFFYLDTQLTRPRRPELHPAAGSLDGRQPLTADALDGGYVQVACPVEGVTARANPVSFGDHFSQAAMFYRSLTPLEQAHIVEAFTFELGKCHEQAVKERQLQVLANVDESLCAQVVAGLGLPAPQGSPPGDVALSQVATEPGPIAGREIGPGVVTADAVGKSFTDQLTEAVGLHRAWERTPAVMALAVPPATGA